jgi:hypothetical protein
VAGGAIVWGHNILSCLGVCCEVVNMCQG